MGVLWLFAGSCLIVFLVGCAAFDRFKAEFLRLRKLASIDVDFNHTKEDDADDEVSDEDKVEELHYAVDNHVNAANIENEHNMQLNAKQSFEKFKSMIDYTMTSTVNTTKREIKRIKERIQKQNVFDNMWINEEVITDEAMDDAVI